MSNVRINRISIRRGKFNQKIELDLSNKIICILGENGSGKTVLLNIINNINYNEKLLDIYASISQLDESFVNEYKTTDEIDVSLRGHPQHKDLNSIHGIENFLSQIEKDIEENRELVKELRHQFQELKKYTNSIGEFLNEQDIPQFYNSIKLNHFHFNELVNTLEGYDNSEFRNIFKFSKKKLILDILLEGRMPYILFNINSESLIDQDETNKFVEKYGSYSIEDDGFKIDSEKILDFVSRTNFTYSQFCKYIATISEKSGLYNKVYDDTDNILYGISKKVNALKNTIFNILDKGFPKVELMPQFNEYSRDLKTDQNEEFKFILSLFELKHNNENYEMLSDGEKWCYQFVDFVSGKNNTLFLLDEPGMLLNPVLQQHLLNVFSYLVTKGNYVIYATHSKFEVNLKYPTYSLENDGKISATQLNISDSLFLQEEFYNEIALLTNQKIIIVEGTNDILFYKLVLNKVFGINTVQYQFFEGKGDGVISIIDFCLVNHITFKAIIDNDKRDKINHAFNTQSREITPNSLVYVGKKEIEDLFLDSDIESICRYDRKLKKHKLCSTKIRTHFSSKKDEYISNELKDSLRKIFQDLNII